LIYELPKLTPRQAFFSSSQTIPIEESINQISAELICPYPPGIPVIMPGEMITQASIETLQQVLKLGGIITGATDPELKTIQIIDLE
jgi:arginine/lysine/ornithine decarboxylase